tara:strand:- start:354 stop:1448 length:1095 start_codon:yes stop_codon:yes gene_type:complete
MKFLDIYNQDKNIINLILKDIKKVIRNTNFILGKEVDLFEKNFAKYCNSKFALGCGNGTDALYLAIKSLNLPKGSEVILPAMTYCSTLFAVIEAGLKPILVDIKNDNPTICAEQIKQKISKNTKLIIMVHLYGEICDYKKIKKTIKSKKIFVIEDAAQAHGAIDKSVKNKKHVGSIGDLACYSFYPGKNLGAYGDAGGIVTNNKKLYERILRLRNIGAKFKFKHDIVGVNSRLDTIQSVILNHKLKYLNSLNQKRKKIAKIYNSKISNPLIEKLNFSNDCVYHQYVILTNNPVKFRNYLKKNSIPFGQHYPQALHQLKAVKKMFKKMKFKNSERLAYKGTSLPINPILKTKDILRVCKVVNDFT